MYGENPWAEIIKVDHHFFFFSFHSDADHVNIME